MGGIPSLRRTRGNLFQQNWVVVLKLLESWYPWRVFDLGDFFLMNLTDESDASLRPPGFFSFRKELRAAVFFLRRDTISLSSNEREG